MFAFEKERGARPLAEHACLVQRSFPNAFLDRLNSAVGG